MRRILFLLTLLLPASVFAQEVTGLAGWSLYIDPGHSGRENMGIFGYSEAEKNLRVGLALRDLLLETTDIDTVYMSRTSDLEQVGLSQRSDHANQVGASWFHSIHSDAGPPSANSTLLLWGQYSNGLEKIPNGGQAMSDLMVVELTEAMRIDSRGSWGDCSFYGGCNGGPYLSVNRRTTMPSELSEAGFHTNPTQNQRNMNAEWKRLEAHAFYWSMLEYHGLVRPPKTLVTGFITDLESGLPLNGAEVAVADRTYTTDTYASLFYLYSNDPDQLHNGFYYFENAPAGAVSVTVTAPDYEPFEGDATVVEGDYTFFDVQLISTVPPTVAAASPEAMPDRFPVTDAIVLDFSRRMDRASVEAALTLMPEADLTYSWTSNDTRLIIRPDSLQPITDYTLTIGGTARGQFEHSFDGDGDGTGGDAYTLTFRTSPEDIQAPRLQASWPLPNTTDAAQHPIITLYYDEPVDPASATDDLFRLTESGSTDPVPGTIVVYEVDGQGLISFFPDAPLSPDTPHRFEVAPGVADRLGNVETNTKRFTFTTGSTAWMVTDIDPFGRDLRSDWWVPQQSGSTTGILTDSTLAEADTAVVNLLTDSEASLRVDYGWDENAGTWLIREYLAGGAPRDVFFDSTYTLQAYVFGDGSGNRFRFAVDDGGAGGHEVSPWYTVDWRGWRLVSWAMSRDGTGTWIGDDTLDGPLRFDSFQLTYTPGSPATGRFYFDDLRLAKPATSTATEPGHDLPEAFTLYQNYPNPFNPATTLRFELGAPAEISLRIYNVLGAEVATLAADEPFVAGTHEVVWHAGDLPSGVYFARMQAGTRHAAIRLVLLK